MVELLLTESGGHTVLDAGCGTGRVAIELSRRGFAVAGIDADPDMLAAARAKAPALTWLHGDLSDTGALAATAAADLVLLAGNVMILLEPGTEALVLTNPADRLTPGGLLVAGLRLQSEGVTLDRYDELAAASGLQSVARWASWDREPFEDGDHAVSVHGAPR